MANRYHRNVFRRNELRSKPPISEFFVALLVVGSIVVSTGCFWIGITMIIT